MLDVHSHILPNIDDGVRSYEESLEIIQRLVRLGFTDIVATPHFYPGRYTPSVQEINVALEKLKERLTESRINVNILRGRECFLDYELLTAEDRDTFSFDWKGKKYQLIELPQLSVPRAIDVYVQNLKEKNILPILAHAERYNRIIRNPDEIRDYIQMGFIIQIDLLSFSSSAHRVIRQTAMSLLKLDCVHIVATDVHKPKQLDGIEEAIQFLRQEFEKTDFDSFFSLT